MSRFRFRYRSCFTFLVLVSISIIGMATLHLYQNHVENFINMWTSISGSNSTTFDVPQNGTASDRDLRNILEVTGCKDVPHWQTHLYHYASLPPTLGHKNKTKKFLTIGISSVYREEQYLQKTLMSLINGSDLGERRDAVVVIYLADTDPEKKEKQLRLIERDFLPHLDSGFFQVIQSAPEIYPPMDFALTKRTFNDSVERILWRAKQVIDFAFLFTYSKTLSDYYLVMEDDIITSTQYITAIRDFIGSRGTHHWIALQYADFLGIGLLFRSADLDNLSMFLMMFHQVQPVDMLMRGYVNLQNPKGSKIARRIPSIFQHIGNKSSLPNKFQATKDITFGTVKRRFMNQNPSAIISTTMEVHKGFIPVNPYRTTPGYFWGLCRPDDTYDIIFTKPLSLSRVVILSGLKNKEGIFEDSIQDAEFLVSSSLQKVAINNSTICDNFVSVKKFEGGVLDFQKSEVSGTSNIIDKLNAVQCIRIKVGPNQKPWVVLREIQVFIEGGGEGSGGGAGESSSPQ